MQNSIELHRTGDFWIDIGLIGVWNFLSAKGSKVTSTKYDIKVEVLDQEDMYQNEKVKSTLILSPASLTLGYDEDRILDEQLSTIINSIEPYYLGEAKTGRIWWQRLGRFFFGNQDPKVFFESPTVIVKKQKGKWKKGICDFCGAEERDIKQVGAGEHPLVVVPGKFSSFYSNLRGDTKICNWCALASKFSPIKLFYAIYKKSITVIAFEGNNLTDLLNIFRSFSRLFAQSEWYRNFPNVMKYTQYPLEGFLDFLFATMIEVDKKQDSEGRDILKSGLISKVHIIQATSGQGLSIDRYYVIPNLPKIFDFISSCKWLDKNQKSYNSLIETAKSLISRRGTDVETTIREEFARRLLYNNDVTDLLEEFLIKQIDAKFPIKPFVGINIDKFITMYSLNQMGMDSNQLRVARQFGDLIGHLAKASDNKSLLYNLRSIGNLENLLSFFHQLLVRYVDNIKPDKRTFETLLYEIDNTNWFTYKSLIGIFSVLKYTETKSKDQEQKEMVMA